MYKRQSISGGLPEIAANLATLFDNPFSIKLCGDSLKTVLILLLCYGMGIGIYFSTRKNYRRREEHGSAKWGNVRAIDKKYRQKPLSENKLMTQNVCIGLNAKKHRRNLNTLVCGGSGAGKTRFYAKPSAPAVSYTHLSVDTASEALAVSLGEKATIDMDYMMELFGKSENEIFEDLKGVIFLNPLYEYGNSYEPKYLMADEYLSGNVREKLRIAKKSAELYPEDYKVNVEALQKVQPKDLTASEISVRLGATWLPPDDVQEFIFHLLETPRYAQWNIKVHFSPFTSEWNIEGKSYDKGNVRAYNTYGTSRINAYKIIEETLNLKDVRIFDYIEDDEGKKKAVLNKKETAIAQSKQEMIKQEFQDWIWSDPERRERLCKSYNEKFNSVRPREYDGSHIIFNGMNPEIELREHQKNAVAHILYGGNTLLAHAVGAGKTFEMVAAAQESKRLGLCNKSLFVVPNHLTEQWATEYLQLYPAANILVATKKDFETKNRKKFCGRIAFSRRNCGSMTQRCFAVTEMRSKRICSEG